MGMFKVFGGMAALLMLVMPTMGVAKAKSFYEDKRYICKTNQAAGWVKGRKYKELSLTDPDTQYIIEPMIMTIKRANSAEEGYTEGQTTHSIKQLGLDDTLATCGWSYDRFQLECYNTYGDLNNEIGPNPEFIIYSTQGRGKTIFMTRINMGLVYHPKLSSGYDDPVLEVGDCKKF